MRTMKPFASLCAAAFVACNGPRTHALAALTSAPPPMAVEKSHANNSAPLPSMDSNSQRSATAPAPDSAGVRKWAFDDDAPGGPPPGFTFGRTGSGRQGNWIVQLNPTAPSGKNVLAQLDADNADYRFPLAVANEPLFRDGSVSVRCRSVSGSVDQACGLVFRYLDPDNYYVTRANALENNVRLYHVKNGRRQQFAGCNGTISSGHWHSLRVEAKGDHFEVYWDDKKLIDAHDSTFLNAGQIGVWTKADSVTYFDDLQVRAMP